MLEPWADAHGCPLSDQDIHSFKLFFNRGRGLEVLVAAYSQNIFVSCHHEKVPLQRVPWSSRTALLQAQMDTFIAFTMSAL